MPTQGGRTDADGRVQHGIGPLSGDFTKRVGVGDNVYNYIQAPQTVVFEGKHAVINGAPVNRLKITSFQKWCTDHPLFLEPPIKFEYKILLITGILYLLSKLLQ